MNNEKNLNRLFISLPSLQKITGLPYQTLYYYFIREKGEAVISPPHKNYICTNAETLEKLLDKFGLKSLNAKIKNKAMKETKKLLDFMEQVDLILNSPE